MDNKEKLVDTSDKLSMSADELKEIIDRSNKEYSEINSTKSDNNILSRILAIGVLILIVMLARTIAKTNDTIKNNNISSEKISITIDKDGKIIDNE